MAQSILSTFRQSSSPLRRKIIALFAALVAVNLVAWGWALVSFTSFPVLLGTALLAWSFGLRHAVDADHIAAIDNVTRKLMQQGQKPVGVGLYFSLGHSTVVILASVLVAATATAFKDQIEAYHGIGGVIGTCVSAFFLLLIAVLNGLVLLKIRRAFKDLKEGRTLDHESLDDMLAGGGYLTKILRPAFRLVTKSWHMYPLGFLFGLGFDTATEVGLLGISAASAAKGMDIWVIMVFPVLFTSGMALIDTVDSVLMLGAYGWAFVKPVRKLYYNMTITSVSVLVALIVGGVEALGLIADELSLSGPFWNGVGTINDNFGNVGFLIVAIFLLAWGVSYALYRMRGYEEVEVVRPAKPLP